MKTATGQSGARRIRVGIIGANPDRGWAAQAHIPALKSLPDDFEITALSTTLIGSGMGWGPTVEPFNAYLNDKKNGATMLSIALGHAADALCHCLGEVRELSATMTVRRKSFTIAETGESKPMTAEDQVLVSGLLEGGAALSIHYRGGVSRGTNLLWEINGTEGDLQLTAAGGQAQIFEMTVRGGKGAQASLEVLPVPEKYWWSPPQDPGACTSVAQAYARFARDY